MVLSIGLMKHQKEGFTLQAVGHPHGPQSREEDARAEWQDLFRAALMRNSPLPQLKYFPAWEEKMMPVHDHLLSLSLNPRALRSRSRLSEGPPSPGCPRM